MSQELNQELTTEQTENESPAEGATPDQAEPAGQNPTAEPEQPAEG
jgi:hypothetical protein